MVKEIGCNWEAIGQTLGGMSGIKIRNRYYSRIYKKKNYFEKLLKKKGGAGGNASGVAGATDDNQNLFC